MTAIHDMELTEIERRSLETEIAKILGEERADEIVDSETASLPLDAGLEIVVRQVDQPFDESHVHEHPMDDKATVLNLQPADAQEFEREFTEKWMLPALYKQLTEVPEVFQPGTWRENS